MDKMRTRFLNKMTHNEVVEYRKRGDIIFVPFGTVEVHGQFPLDVEQTVPEACAYLMAEKVDGLVLGELPYFFPGASPMSPGTVQMSVEAGVRYLKEIAHSLLNQGFRRQIYVSCHGPAFLTAGTVVVDFFDETKVPIAYMDMVRVIEDWCRQGHAFSDYDALMCGAYDVLNRKDELVVDPEIEIAAQVPGTTKLGDYFHRYAPPSGAVGFYFAQPQDHAGMTGAFHTVQERDDACRKGAQAMREIIDSMALEQYVADMRGIDRQTSEELIPRYGDILPRNRF